MMTYDFGSSVEEDFENKDCKVMRVSGVNGEGIMTVYPLLDGVYLIFNNFHMKESVSSFDAGSRVLCIDHCREGRIETGLSNHGSCPLCPGEIRVDAGNHNNGKSQFPLNHYYGITVGIEVDKAKPAIKEYIRDFSVDLDALYEKYCNDREETVIPSSPVTEHLFAELYSVPLRIRTDYYRIKVLELLLYLDALKIGPELSEAPCFFQGHSQKIQEIHKFLVSDLSHTYTIGQLSSMFGISSTSLKTSFIREYGSPVFSYMKSYRLNYAASLLKNRSDIRVSDVAGLVGYESPSKFAVAFRKEFGSTPLDYRKYSDQREVKSEE